MKTGSTLLALTLITLAFFAAGWVLRGWLDAPDTVAQPLPNDAAEQRFSDVLAESGVPEDLQRSLLAMNTQLQQQAAESYPLGWSFPQLQSSVLQH